MHHSFTHNTVNNPEVPRPRDPKTVSSTPRHWGGLYALQALSAPFQYCNIKSPSPEQNPSCAPMWEVFWAKVLPPPPGRKNLEYRSRPCISKWKRGDYQGQSPNIVPFQNTGTLFNAMYDTITLAGVSNPLPLPIQACQNLTYTLAFMFGRDRYCSFHYFLRIRWAHPVLRVTNGKREECQIDPRQQFPTWPTDPSMHECR